MATFTRTANAGGVLELDGKKIFLDAVSRPAGQFLPTPPALREEIKNIPLDAMVFTHSHFDHFDPDFVREHPPTLLLGTGEISRALPGLAVEEGAADLGGVTLTPLPSRHMGAAYRQVPHRSYVVSGSLCLWLMGDAAPAQWLDRLPLPAPDVLVAPFPYAATEAGWRAVAHLAPRLLVVTHLPDPAADRDSLWPAVEAVLAAHPAQRAVIPAIGEQVALD